MDEELQGHLMRVEFATGHRFSRYENGEIKLEEFEPYHMFATCEKCQDVTSCVLCWGQDGYRQLIIDGPCKEVK